jgi:hypothetical protein
MANRTESKSTPASPAYLLKHNIPGAPAYLARAPKPDEMLPPGVVIVHNQVRPPTLHLGSRGFRAWLQPIDQTVEVCGCGFAPSIGPYYRRRLS